MTRRRPPSPFDLAPWLRHGIRTWEIAVAAPQVIAHRTARIARAGHSPNARDRREFVRMGAEKLDAFGESLLAMGLRAWQAQQAAMWSAMQQWWRAALQPLQLTRATQAATIATRAWPVTLAPHELARTWAGVFGAGIGPVHRRVTANARRLSRIAAAPAKAARRKRQD